MNKSTSLLIVGLLGILFTWLTEGRTLPFYLNEVVAVIAIFAITISGILFWIEKLPKK